MNLLSKLMGRKAVQKAVRFRKPSILVVGGSGFIGSHLRPFIKADNIDLKEGSDFCELVATLPEYKTVVFLAADKNSTKEAYDHNLKLYLALREYVVRYPNTHIIYSSSASVYKPTDDKHKENDSVVPINLYGQSKLLGEVYVADYKHHTILRFSNVYGEGGEGVVDLFRQNKRTIYGDGEQIRDFISVEAVVDIIVRAIKDPEKWQGIFNVSTGHGRTINSIFEEYGKGKPIYKEAREGDRRCSILDNSKMKEVLYG